MELFLINYYLTFEISNIFCFLETHPNPEFPRSGIFKIETVFTQFF